LGQQDLVLGRIPGTNVLSTQETASINKISLILSQPPNIPNTDKKTKQPQETNTKTDLYSDRDPYTPKSLEDIVWPKGRRDHKERKNITPMVAAKDIHPKQATTRSSDAVVTNDNQTAQALTTAYRNDRAETHALFETTEMLKQRKERHVMAKVGHDIAKGARSEVFRARHEDTADFCRSIGGVITIRELAPSDAESADSKRSKILATMACKGFKAGKCKYGQECKFSHNKETKTECRNFKTGKCRFGDACNFTHNKAAGQSDSHVIDLSAFDDNTSDDKKQHIAHEPIRASSTNVDLPRAAADHTQVPPVVEGPAVPPDILSHIDNFSLALSPRDFDLNASARLGLHAHVAQNKPDYDHPISRLSRTAAMLTLFRRHFQPGVLAATYMDVYPSNTTQSLVQRIVGLKVYPYFPRRTHLHTGTVGFDVLPTEPMEFVLMTDVYSHYHEYKAVNIHGYQLCEKREDYEAPLTEPQILYYCDLEINRTRTVYIICRVFYGQGGYDISGEMAWYRKKNKIHASEGVPLHTSNASAQQPVLQSHTAHFDNNWLMQGSTADMSVSIRQVGEYRIITCKRATHPPTSQVTLPLGIYDTVDNIDRAELWDDLHVCTRMARRLREVECITALSNWVEPSKTVHVVAFQQTRNTNGGKAQNRPVLVGSDAIFDAVTAFGRAPNPMTRFPVWFNRVRINTNDCARYHNYADFVARFVTPRDENHAAEMSVVAANQTSYTPASKTAWAVRALLTLLLVVALVVVIYTYATPLIPSKAQAAAAVARASAVARRMKAFWHSAPIVEFSFTAWKEAHEHEDHYEFDPRVCQLRRTDVLDDTAARYATSLPDQDSRFEDKRMAERGLRVYVHGKLIYAPHSKILQLPSPQADAWPEGPVSHIYPLLCSSLVFQRPRKSLLAFVNTVLYRLTKQPKHSPCFVEATASKRWLNAARLFYTLIAAPTIEHVPTWQDVLDALTPAKAKALIDAKFNVDTDSKPYTRTINIKTNEILRPKQMADFNTGMIARCITVLDPMYHAAMAQYSRALAQLLKQTLNQEHVWQFPKIAPLQVWHKPISIIYASGMLRSELDQVFAKLQENTVFTIVVAGDDTIGCWGSTWRQDGHPTPYFECDYTMFDQTQTEHCAQADTHILPLMGFPPWFMRLLSQASQGPVSVVDIKRQWKITVEPGYQMPTGISTTTAASCLHNAIALMYMYIRWHISRLAPHDALGELGLVAKFVDVEESSQLTFLRGWWPDNKHWTMLPSCVMKLGKLLQDPMTLVVATSRSTYQTAVQSMARGVALGCGFIPPAMPITGAFLAACLRPADAGLKLRHNIVEAHKTIIDDEQAFTASDRKLVLDAIHVRYGVAPERVMDLEKLFSNITSLPCVYYHDIMAPLLDRDYA